MIKRQVLHYITLHKTFIVRNHTEATDCALVNRAGSNNKIKKKCKVIKVSLFVNGY